MNAASSLLGLHNIFIGKKMNAQNPYILTITTKPIRKHSKIIIHHCEDFEAFDSVGGKRK